MKAYAYEHTMKKDGVLSLTDLPFSVGEKIEIVIISHSQLKNKAKRYPFWGKSVQYLNPTEPVAEKDWGLYG